MVVSGTPPARQPPTPPGGTPQAIPPPPPGTPQQQQQRQLPPANYQVSDPTKPRFPKPNEPHMGQVIIAAIRGIATYVHLMGNNGHDLNDWLKVEDNTRGFLPGQMRAAGLSLDVPTIAIKALEPEKRFEKDESKVGIRVWYENVLRILINHGLDYVVWVGKEDNGITTYYNIYKQTDAISR